MSERRAISWPKEMKAKAKANKENLIAFGTEDFEGYYGAIHGPLKSKTLAWELFRFIVLLRQGKSPHRAFQAIWGKSDKKS